MVVTHRDRISKSYPYVVTLLAFSPPQVTSSGVEPILIAAGGGGASDSVGAVNDPNAKGFVSSTRAMSKEDIMGRVRDEDKDAGESVPRQMQGNNGWWRLCRVLSPTDHHPIMCSPPSMSPTA